jgi:hypothetical protein
MAHKAARVNPLYGFTLIVADEGLAVEDKVFQVSMLIEESDLIDKISRVWIPYHIILAVLEYQCASTGVLRAEILLESFILFQ